MSLENVLIDEMRDLYSAENQLVKALPKMAKAAVNPELKNMFTTHLEETKGHVERLKQGFERLGKKATGQHCNGMEGLIEEGKDAIEKDEEGATKDVCLLGAALRVEHYEIAGYTSTIAIAKALGEAEIVSLLTETLREEEATSNKVLAQSKPTLSESASQGDEEEDDDAAPKTAKEKESDKKSKQDEAGARTATKQVGKKKGSK
ncbi:MAG: ferritin-like domain-containing protein [Acidobacteriota bacterium]|nr:ferritin-like domain-containing protein [Acidobacteriota bacterium]